MRKYERDYSQLRDALENYDPAGVHVVVDTFGGGTIRSQVLQGRGGYFASGSQPSAMFTVDLDKAISFTDYADTVNASTEPIPIERLAQEYNEDTLAWILDQFPPEAKTEGLSRRDILKVSIANTGCLNDAGNVTCVTAPWNRVRVDPLEPGQLVEFSESDPSHVSSYRIWEGRIVGGKGKMAYMEVFEPLPQERAPESILPKEIKPGFYSSKSWVFAESLYDEWKELEPDTLPPGEFVTEPAREYRLEVPVELDYVKSACKRIAEKAHPGEDEICWWQAIIFFVLPLELGYDGVFRPLRASGEAVRYWFDELEAQEEMGI